jgi:hypothetical protein
MNELGKSADEVGQMTIRDVLFLFSYWREVPPVAETMLAAFGGKSSRSSQVPSGPMTTEDEKRNAAKLGAFLRNAAGVTNG